MTNKANIADRLYIVHREGRGLPVVFLNSLAADFGMWDEVLERLPDHETLTFDARGHGRSAVVPGETNTANLARDTLDAMDAAGIDSAVLCGLSLGGLTAMKVAEMAPDRVAGLVLANTAVSFPPPAMWTDRAASAREGGLAPLLDATIERWLTEEFRAANPERTTQIRDMIAATPSEGYAVACSVLATGDGTNALANFAGPVLVLAGAYDASTPPARAEEMAVIQPRASVVVLEAAHLSSVEAPDDFAQHLKSFLDGIDGAGNA